MKPEKQKSTRQWLTDKDRDTIVRLFDCGFSYEDIANTMHISTSSVSNIRSAYLACKKQDWSAIQKMSTTAKATIDGAMRVTGADKAFAELFPTEPATEETVPEPAVEPVPNSITREDFLSLNNTLQDICYLLTEIRDILK